MKENEKKPAPTQPTGNNTEPATTQNASQDQPQQDKRQDDNQDAGDYAIVGSGLGIDE